MQKLPPSATNVRFVADELAREIGSREKVSLSDVRALIGGEAGTVAAHFGAWLVAAAGTDGAATDGPAREPGDVPGRGSDEMKERFDDLTRLVVGAIRDGAASRRPAVAAAAGPDGAAAGDLRSATADDLREVVRFALSDAEPERLKSFLKDVWEKGVTAETNYHRISRPADTPKPRRLKRGRRRPDIPKPVRRERAAERLEAVKATAFASVGAGKPARTLRRVPRSDYAGAANRFLARHAATALRNAGYPLMPGAICKDIAARGGPIVRKPSLNLMPHLAGSPMVRVGSRGQIWFASETPPAPPKPSGRLDTAEALNRELAARLFARALDILRTKGPRGMSIGEVAAELGDAVKDFNRDWLAQRLKREASDPASHIRKVSAGFALIVRKRAAAKGRP